MTDKIIEITPQEFRKKLTEMVRLEIAKRLMEAEETMEPEVSAVDDEKKGISNVVQRRISDSEAAKFLQFVKDSSVDPELKDVSSLEQFVSVVAKKFPNSADAKKFVEDLVTGFRVGKKEKTNEPVSAAAEKTHSRAEAILSSIHDVLTVNRGPDAKAKSKENFIGFANWIKKNYPTITDTADDSVTTLTKYADFFAKGKIPAGKSWKEDLNLFKTISKVSKTSSEIEALQAKDQARIDKVKDATTKNVTVAGLGDAMGVEAVGKAIGTSGRTIQNILQAIPAGKGNAIYLVLKNALTGNDVSAARRTLKDFEAVFKKAVESAKKEFIMLIEDAGELEPEENMITRDNLAKVLQDAGFREDLTPAEVANENMFLEHLADIVNTHGEDEWKPLVGEMLQLDLEEKGQNILKSFQNIVAKAMGVFDPASFAPGRGRPSEKEMNRRAAIDKQFGQKFTVSGREDEPTT